MAQPRFTPRQLDAFIAAAELNNFTLASRRLNLTPSAISNLINELETSLGFRLFERTTRKVTLTPDGREFLPAALAVQRQLQLAATAAADVRNRSVEVVRVAAPLSVAAGQLPGLVADYKRLHPRVVIRIVDTGVEWLADRVATGEADLALGPDRAVGADVDCAPLFASTWVLWCAPDHPLAAKRTVDWSDLQRVDVYAAGRDHEHSVMPRLADVPNALRLDQIQVVENITTALGIAAAGVGVTFAPAYVASMAAPLRLVMRPILDPEIKRYMSLYSPLRRPLSEAARQFRDYVVEALGETAGADPKP